MDREGATYRDVVTFSVLLGEVLLVLGLMVLSIAKVFENYDKGIQRARSSG